MIGSKRILACSTTYGTLLIIVDVRGSHKMQEYKAIIKHEEKWWYGWVEEIPGVNCQEESEEQLMQSLRTTLLEAIEFNREDALKSASGNFTEVGTRISVSREVLHTFDRSKTRTEN